MFPVYGMPGAAPSRRPVSLGTHPVLAGLARRIQVPARSGSGTGFPAGPPGKDLLNFRREHNIPGG